ncbi:4519_t:CDS:2 [Acaulospora morrowiae]|uniref:4519_t:CDS:1 n=1 Tax=Acaulospora morrowiae TaxID=94023 RepID=A0A9N8ZF47_9GLOM|nr:4519_t:CDS:2 [Acaulospora morrowiae]
MLFCTSLVALVGAGEHPSFSPRRLQITNTKRQSTICELTFQTSILAVKLNRRRLIVVLEQTIFVYDISNMKLLHSIETSPNPSAICALSPSNENCYIAYPSQNPSPSSPFSNNSLQNTTSGDVLIFDALSLQNVNYVQAHKSPVAYVAINSEGTLLATASDKGTVIRVFSIPNAQKLYQFRRGSYPARIHSISFNLVSTLLCVSSDTETVHVFKLGGNTGGSGSNASSNNGSSNGTGGTTNPMVRHSVGSPNIGGFEAFIDGKKKSGGVGSTIRRQSLHLRRTLADNVGNYLPDALTEMWEPTRDFAYLKLPSSGVQSVVALSNTTPQVMVVTSEGYFYQYNIDLENGGECVLLKQYSLLEPNEDLGTSLISD